VVKVTATITNFSHTFPGDVDLLLVGPGGQNVMLMSDVGGGTDAVNATITFDDAAAPIGATVVSGTFRPTNSGTDDQFPAPAPAAPHGAALSFFSGLNPNGDWSGNGPHLHDHHQGDRRQRRIDDEIDHRSRADRNLTVNRPGRARAGSNEKRRPQKTASLFLALRGGTPPLI
jgi:hypothetical protein